MISYDKLWKTMEEKNETTYSLIFHHGIHKSTIDRFKHNQNVTVFTLGKLCEILDCNIEDIVEYKKVFDARNLVYKI